MIKSTKQKETIKMKKTLQKTLGILLSAAIAFASVSVISYASSAPPSMPGGSSGGPGKGANTQEYDYSGSYSGALTADGESKQSDSETISATNSDQNAVLSENGGTAAVTNGTITKTGSDSDGDNCNFYGVNSIVLSVGDSSKVYIKDSNLSADSEGSNGLFSTDSGTIYALNDTVTTTAGNSRGIDATYGGTVVASKMNISTSGDHSAALATDRGGGNVSVADSELKTQGAGSPLIYSTGDIEVSNVTGEATGSQIAGMEGLNKIIILNSSLTSSNTKSSGSDPIADAVIIYQSTSGDADASSSTSAEFQAIDSTLTSAITSGAFFYITNTTADILLKNTTLNYDSDNAYLIRAEGNDSNNWGTAGSNGGKATVTLDNETVSGNISADTISALDIYIVNNSTYTGSTYITTNSVNTDKSDSPISVTLDSSSKWVLTGDSAVTNLSAANGAQIVDESGKTATIVAGGKTVVKGTSDVTLTVTGTYSAEADTSGASSADSDFISRTDFDSYFGTNTDTLFTSYSSGESTTTEKTTASSTSSNSSNDIKDSNNNEEQHQESFFIKIIERIRSFFRNIIDKIESIFSK